MSFTRWDRPPVPSDTVPETAAPVTKCPFCESTRVATTTKAVSSSTYWRCEACGEIWNPGRQRSSTSQRRGW